jgi:hypothetical protein
MESTLLAWLEGVGSTAFRWSVTAFFVVNGIALATMILTRDRSLVNRWTGRVLAANLALSVTGIGIPLVSAVTRLAVAAVLPGGATSVMPTLQLEDGEPLELRMKD